MVAKAGIPLDHITGKKGVYIDLTSTLDQTINLLAQGLNLEILIPDLTMDYQTKNTNASSREFPLGSMQGNYTWDELNTRFDELQNLYPNIISERIILGQSIEGRDIWAFKVSDNPEQDEDEPEVLFTALTHAREPVGMMNLFYFVQLMGEEYESDPELTFLVNNREMWFLPVVNPDGYVYNESIQPNGGGMHRKNRLDTNCGNGTDRGVDLNRNYGFGWGANDTGSSPNPCHTTYRGDSAFSEPETQAVRDFIINRNFINVMHYHTYSNVYIHAFGDASLPDEPDLTTFREIGNEMARFNGYPVGTGYELIGYTVNGDAVDWTYGDQGLISFTPEVGSYLNGFWPSESDIHSLCEDQVYPNKIFAFVTGPDIILHSYDLSHETINQGESVGINIVIQNRGLVNTNGDIEIVISPLNSSVTIDINSYSMSEMDARDSDDFSVTAMIDQSALNGIYSGILVSIEGEGLMSRQDTIKFLIGQPEIIYFDGFEDGISNWDIVGDWGETTDVATGVYAMTDSPLGNYQAGQESIIEISNPVDFSLLTIPSVRFKAKWNIESNWDFVRFQAHVLGDGWVSLNGYYTEPGSGQPAQPYGEPGYDGIQTSWVEDVILLEQLGDVEILGFRFILTSDNFVEEDGFTFDDFTIMGFQFGPLGDFNEDAVTDVFDIIELADLLFFETEPTENQLNQCDFNNDGGLDFLDIISLTNYILGI